MASQPVQQETKELAVDSASPGEKSPQEPTVLEMTEDEHHLATLGYRQIFIRAFGMFENWAATFTTMNFVSGMPALFGYAMYTGGPQAGFANWTMIGGFSLLVSLAMAEIAAALPTVGGIYYWAYRLGGPKYGPMLAWLTGWYNWCGWLTIIPGQSQGNTNFLLSLLAILYPESAVIQKAWFGWCLATATIIMGLIPNCISQASVRWMLRSAAYFTIILMSFYWIWFPIAASRRKGFDRDIFTTFVNGINGGVDAEGNTIMQASNSYCWVVGVLFGAWEFYGYDASVHIAEETHKASSTVAKGMWTGTLATWLGSVPTLALVMLCIQDLNGINNAGYANNWAEYLVQLIGKKGAVAVLALTWLDGLLLTGICFLSAQRITYAIARDGMLPYSHVFSRVSKGHHLPVNAAILVAVLSSAICAAVIGSYVAFSAITAAATIGTNLSYLIPILARRTVGRKIFKPAKWNLGKWSVPVSTIAILYIMFLFCVLMLPQLYPVTAQTLNYAPVVIGAITLIAFGGWFFPVVGARHWFTGPKRTISEIEVMNARVKASSESS